MTTVGHRIRVAQIYAGFKSADDLAEELALPNLSAKTLRRTIADARPAEPHELEAIARVCQVPLEFLTDDRWLPTENGADRLARLEEKLDGGIVEQQDLRDQIAQQNRNLGQQTEILAELKGIAQGIAELVGREAQVLARIEELVGVLKDAEISTEPVAAGGAVDLGRPPAPPEGLGLGSPDQKPTRQSRRAKDAQSRDQRRDAS